VRGESARSRRATRRRVAGDRSLPSCGTKAASGSGRVDELGICSREVTPDPGYAIDLGPAPEAARTSAERLRTVAPVPGPTPAAATPARPRTAADIAALSYGRKPFRVTPADVPTHPRPTDDPAHLRPSPDQYRVRGPTI
jgi:hypothetical protein